MTEPTSTQSPKVLVVDDEPEVEVMFRQRMRKEIRSGQYEFLFAQSGKSALVVLDENPDIRLVLTDLNMPEMDGLALLDAMAEAWPLTPSMVVSAYADEARQAQVIEHGANGFVAKPVDFPELKERIAGTVNKS